MKRKIEELETQEEERVHFLDVVNMEKCSKLKAAVRFLFLFFLFFIFFL